MISIGKACLPCNDDDGGRFAHIDALVKEKSRMRIRVPRDWSSELAFAGISYSSCVVVNDVGLTLGPQASLVNFNLQLARCSE